MLRNHGKGKQIPTIRGSVGIRPQDPPVLKEYQPAASSWSLCDPTDRDDVTSRQGCERGSAKSQGSVDSRRKTKKCCS